MDSLSLAEMNHDEILARVRTGCGPSFGELVGRYERRLTRYVENMLCRHRGRVRRGDADDIVQETWLRALRCLDRYDARWAFSTWLFTIARRSCLTQLRTIQRARALEAAVARPGECDHLPGPLTRAIEAEQTQRLWNAVAVALPQRQAAAVRLHYGEGMAIDDIAAAVGTSPGAVKLSLFRARRRLATVITTGCLLALAVIPAARTGSWRSTPPAAPVGAKTVPVAIHLLPTPTDLHEALLVQGSALAAGALGLPSWHEVAGFASLDGVSSLNSSLHGSAALDRTFEAESESAVGIP